MGERRNDVVADGREAFAQTEERPSAAHTSEVKAKLETQVPVGAALDDDGKPLLFGRGTRIKRFVVERRLGEGGMGVVLAARDPKLRRRVALKLLRLDMNLSTRVQARARMLREAQAMARVTHPNLVTIYEVGTVGQHVFLAMEFVSGVTLRRWLRKTRPLHQVIDLFEQAGRALQAVHDAGLVHRDFKPANVMVTKKHVAKVLDLGIARKADEEIARVVDGPPTSMKLETMDTECGGGRPAPGSQRFNWLDSDLTTAGQLIGTPAYMAPEQLRGEGSTPATDQFAFAVALFEALAGRRPFEANDRDGLLAAMEERRMSPWPEVSAMPPGLRKPLERALAADPEDRFPSMTALLSTIRESLGVRLRLPELASNWQQDDRPKRRLLEDSEALAESWSLLQRYPDALTGAEAEFIRASWNHALGRRLKRRGAIAGAGALALLWAPTAWLLERRSAELAEATERRVLARISSVRDAVLSVFNQAEGEILRMFEQRHIWMPLVVDALAPHAQRGASQFETKLVAELKRINDYFRPVVEGNQMISSLMLATDEDDEVLVFDDPDAENFTPPYRLYNRLVRKRAFNENAFEVFWPPGPDGEPHWNWLYVGGADRRGQPWMGYTPTARPWFRDATEHEVPTISWTRPYLFFVTKDAGITGSISWRSGPTRYVLGVDFMLTDISLTATQLDDSEFLAMVLTRQGGVVGLPADQRFGTPKDVRSFFAEFDTTRRAEKAQGKNADSAAQLPLPADLGIGVLTRAAEARPARDGVFAFDYDGQQRWAGLASLGAPRLGLEVLVVQR